VVSKAALYLAAFDTPPRREAATVNAMAVGLQVSTIKRMSHRIARSAGTPIKTAM
jgi:hypothetical protein